MGIAAELLGSPKVLILDEPPEGLDPEQKAGIRAFIKEYAADHTVMVSTHVMEEVEAVAARVLVLDRGRLVADASLEELKKSGGVLRSFLELVGRPADA